MKSILIGVVLAVTSVNAVAKNPGIICVASTKYHILIETEKKQVRLSEWGEIVATAKIVSSDVKFFETKPPTYNYVYHLDTGEELNVSFRGDSEKGKGAIYRDGQKTVDYPNCYRADDIQRE